jgi:hypothetical protein
VRSFKEIIEGKHDDLPERAFLLKGAIDDVVEVARGESDEPEESESNDDENAEKGENGDDGEE